MHVELNSLITSSKDATMRTIWPISHWLSMAMAMKIGMMRNLNITKRAKSPTQLVRWQPTHQILSSSHSFDISGLHGKSKRNLL